MISESGRVCLLDDYQRTQTTMALVKRVGPGPVMTVGKPSADVVKFRESFQKKAVGISKQKTMLSQVKSDGFNPHAMLYTVTVFTSAANKQYKQLLLQIGYYTRENFAKWKLPPEFYRWNEELSCIEIAIQRHRTKEEKIKKESDKWNKDLANLEWVAAPPGSEIDLSDWDNNAYKEGSIVQLVYLRPVAKDDAYLKENPGDPLRYNWRAARVVTNYAFSKPVFGELLNSLPGPAFYIDNPKSEHYSQRFVMLKIVAQWDSAALTKAIGEKTCTIFNLNYSPDPEAWGFAPAAKEDDKEDDKAAAAIAAVATAAANAAGSTEAKKPLTNMRMRLNGLASQKREDGTYDYIPIVFNMWEDAVKAMFRIDSFGWWTGCVSHFASAVAPGVFVASVSSKRTHNMVINLTDKKREVGGDDDDDGVVANLDDGPIAEEIEEVPATAAGDAMQDWDAALASAEVTIEAAIKTREEASKEVYSWGVDVTVSLPAFDMWEVMRTMLIPVTPAWVMGKLKTPMVMFYGTGLLVPKKLSDMNEVICVSKYMGSVKEYGIHVVEKRGEFRVAVNTPAYHDSTTGDFIKMVQSLTPVEGALLLDGQPIPGKNVAWVRPEVALYTLYFLNYPARERRNSDLNKLLGPSIEQLSHFIHPEMFVGRDRSGSTGIAEDEPSEGDDVDAEGIKTPPPPPIIHGPALAMATPDKIQEIPTPAADEEPQAMEVVPAPAVDEDDRPVAPGKGKRKVRRGKTPDSGAESGGENPDQGSSVVAAPVTKRAKGKKGKHGST